MYNLERESIKKFIDEHNAGRIAVQLPSGLRPRITEINEIFDENLDVFFLADSCYGACDLSDDLAADIGCDVLIHFGHADMGIPTSIPTLYVEARSEEDPSEVLDQAVSKLRGSTWGLTATVQYVHKLGDIKKFLREKGIDFAVGEPGPRAEYPGQILGCDWGSAKSVGDRVDGFIYVGTGRFHPIGIFLATEKPIISVNPVSGVCEEFEFSMSDFLKKRMAAVESARSGQKIGIFVSKKTGQKRLGLAEELADKLQDQDYDSFLLLGDELDYENLRDYRLDALVNTACPRISFDDFDLFDVPILTPFEVGVMLGEEEWEPYRVDEIGQNF